MLCLYVKLINILQKGRTFKFVIHDQAKKQDIVQWEITLFIYILQIVQWEITLFMHTKLSIIASIPDLFYCVLILTWACPNFLFLELKDT